MQLDGIKWKRKMTTLPFHKSFILKKKDLTSLYPFSSFCNLKLLRLSLYLYESDFKNHNSAHFIINYNFMNASNDNLETFVLVYIST